MVPIAKAFPAMMVAMEHTIKGSAVGNQREAIEVRRIGLPTNLPVCRGLAKTSKWADLFVKQLVTGNC
jgi:propanol-preferring alcohol dehydrogenase